MARTSQRVQSVGSDHLSGLMSIRSAQSRWFSTAAIAIASSCYMRGISLALSTIFVLMIVSSSRVAAAWFDVDVVEEHLQHGVKMPHPPIAAGLVGLLLG